MKRILFFAPPGQQTGQGHPDVVLAAALRARGCEVAIAGCDGFSGDGAEPGVVSAESARNGVPSSGDVFARFGLPFLQLRDFLAPNDFEQAREWSILLDVTSYATAVHGSLPIGEWATDAVLRQLRITAESLHLPEARRVHQGCLVSTLLTSIAFARVLDQFQPDAVVIGYERRAPSCRAVFEAARARGSRVLGLQRAATPGAFTLLENACCDTAQAVSDHIARWSEIPIDADDCARCAEVMRRNDGGKRDDSVPTGGDDARAAEVRTSLAIPADARILGVFTSAEPESGVGDVASPVTSQLDLVDRLIEVFRGRPDYLVVRHAAEIDGDAAAAGDHPLLPRVWRQARIAPANVRIVMPWEKLADRDLFPHLSGSMVYPASACAASVTQAVATAAAPGSSFFPLATFVIADGSEKGLARMVDQLFARTEEWRADDFRGVCRHLSAWEARMTSRFESRELLEADIPGPRLDDLRSGKDRMLDRMCGFLTDGAPLFDLPGDRERQRSRAVEEPFLEEQWKRARVRRWRLGTVDATNAGAKAPATVAIVNVGESAGLPEWCARSRHRALVLRGSVATAGQTSEQILERLKLALESVTESRVLLAGAGFEYDESFLGSAVRALEVDSELDGVSIGAWLAREDGAIGGELFTRRQPCREFHQASCVLPALHEPHLGLSLVLFRTERLKALLEALPPGMAREDTAGRLFGALRGPAFEQWLLPLAMIPADRPRAGEIRDTHRETPVLFLIFNRPDLTQQVFEAIRQQRPRRLFVAADGPRPHLPAERIRCETARRRVIEHVDWDCQVETLFREENLGCKRAVSSAIAWFFERVEEGIVLEDDCLPGPDFFRFCGELLARYRDTPSIMHIGANNFQRGHRRGDGAFYFSKHTHIWGWAGWRRAWRHYDLAMPGLEELLASPAWSALHPDPREAAYWERAFRQTKEGAIDTWDYQWTFTVWKSGGLGVLPQVNLVSNIGFRSDATHTTQESSRAANMAVRPLGPMIIPERLAADPEADALTFRTHFSPPTPSKPAAPAKKRENSTKERDRLARLSAELTLMRESLVWRTVGRPLYSIEKRLRKLFGRKDGEDPAP